MLILARHGATEANDAGTLLGRQAVTLSERGVAESRALASWLDSRHRVGSIHSSVLPRASETARIIAGAIGIESVCEDGRLSERELGPFEGMSRAELIGERRRRGLSSYSPTQDWHGSKRLSRMARCGRGSPSSHATAGR